MCANLSLFTLPPELLTRIFALLEGHQIARCSAVCSYFKHVIECSSVVQYLIKLEMFGYTDVSGSVNVPAIPATRLNQLDKHIDAWNKLDWMESRIDIPLQYHDRGILCQGIFAIFSHTSVCCIQLPHLMRGIQLRTWTLEGFSFPIHQIEIDPSNNLLVVVSRQFTQHGGLTVPLHLLTLSDNSPHPKATNHILFSVRPGLLCPVVRVMGRLLGVALCFSRDLKLEIWDWMTGQKMTMLDMREGDAFARSPFEFLSATSIVVVRQGVLEVYEIRTETPGAPPVHTASFCMPRPNLDEYCSTVRISENPRLSHGIDHRNLSDDSLFPSFRSAADRSYLTINWDLYGPDSTEELQARFHVPLSSLRRSALYGDALVMPWEAWSNGVYFDNDLEMRYQMSGGRLIYFMPSDLDLRCRVSLFDLNRSRAGRPGMTSADPCTHHTPLHVIKSDLLHGEIRMECPHPVHLTSRSFSLNHSDFPQSMLCDDEHIIVWALRCPVRPATDREEARGEDGGVDYVNKLIILTML